MIITLNLKQKQFAEYYAQCGNATESALKSGYSKSYSETRAYKLLENVEICRYIKRLTEKATSERILTSLQRQEILSNIAKDEENQPSDRIKSIDTLNKMTGEYIKKVSITSDEEVPKLLDALKE